MKIFIDIGHPAHVHYFKNFIWLMQEKAHTVFITARDKEVTFQLLDHYNLPYYNRGKGKRGRFSKFLYMFSADLFILKKALKVKPDLFLSFGSPYLAHVAWLIGKPHISFNDTDHSIFEHIMYVPFTKSILTPLVYMKDHGKKHIRFDGFMELCYLHPNRFISNTEEEIRNILKLNKTDKYVILRFVSWGASHDVGLKGLTLQDKYELVKELSKYARVIISSESDLPEDLKQYEYKVNPAFMHVLIKGASLLVGESGTMSAEAAFLGTPNICITTGKAGTLFEEVRLGLIELYKTGDGVVARSIEIMKDNQYRMEFAQKAKKIVADKIDVTAFMIWFVENYPQSIKVLNSNSDFQNKFKEVSSA